MRFTPRRRPQSRVTIEDPLWAVTLKHNEHVMAGALAAIVVFAAGLVVLDILVWLAFGPEPALVIAAIALAGCTIVCRYF